ncbi:MAG: acetate--CoA ligase family protein, partial [Deltaproteobacteria bacterium]|nr:acetate--CoA ligase family protein [Deltaproteobacteria bacterium]
MEPFIKQRRLKDGTIHKTETGLVKLGISTENGIKAAFNELQTAMGIKGKILVQQQIQGDLELIAGLIRDPQFGPCVMVGLGGVLTEVLNDFVFGVAPLTHTQALELIDRLKTQKLLNGFRGAGAVDRNALAKILVKL